MEKLQVLLGIEDAEYGNRLLSYLISHMPGDEFHLFTEPDFFGEELETLSSKTYDAAVLTETFFQEAEECGMQSALEEHIPCIRHLLCAPGEAPRTPQVLYRCRSAGQFTDLLERLRHASPAVTADPSCRLPAAEKADRVPSLWTGGNTTAGRADSVYALPAADRAGVTYRSLSDGSADFLREGISLYEYETGQGRQITGAAGRDWRILHAPAHHELLPALGLVTARNFAEKGPVWLADLSQDDALTRILGRLDAPTVTDAVFLLGTQKDGLQEAAVSWEGVRILLPAAGPQEIGQLTREQWQRLFDALQREPAAVLFLTDTVFPGFELLAERCSRCVAVSRRGTAGEEQTARFLGYVRDRFPALALTSKEVPFSAGGTEQRLWMQTVLRDERLLALAGDLLRDADGALCGDAAGAESAEAADASRATAGRAAR